MSAARTTASRLSLAALAIAALLVIAYLWRPVPAPVAPPPPAMNPSARGASTAAPSVTGAAPAPTGAGAVGGVAPETTAPPSAAALAAADEHQGGKIARGLSEHGGNGLLVNSAVPGSVTEQLRLQPGDIVVTVNGEPVDSIADFVRIYRAEGTPTQLTILRSGREMHLH